MAGRRLALIVATDAYDDPGLRQLRAPAADAQALADVLADPELGEFDVEVLRNGTSSTIGERVEALLTGGRPEDLIVLHFSCHGLKDEAGGLFLAATNTRPALLSSTAVDAALVNRLMRRSRAQRVVLFLDCCYGGAFERGMIPRAAGTVDVADQFQQQDQELGGGRGRVVITASNAMEFAFEGTDLADSASTRPSVFTGAVVEGLATGKADRDQDGLVALGELYDYVFERVRHDAPSQTPGKWEFGLQGELILAKNPQRVVVPARIPADLVELTEHPFPATRLGAVEVLVRIAEGTDLPLAAGARGVLERMANDDSRAVAGAAADAVERTALRLSAASVDVGTLRVGEAAPPLEVSIEGPPLAVASRVATSSPAVRARRIDRTIRIEPDTAAAGEIDAIVTVDGPAGTASVHVAGVVVPAHVGKDVHQLPEPEPEPEPQPEPQPQPEPEPQPEREPQPALVRPQQGVDAAPLTEVRAEPASQSRPEPTSGGVMPVREAAAGDHPGAEPPDADPYRSGRWHVSRALARGSLGALVGDVIGIAWASWQYQLTLDSSTVGPKIPSVVADIVVFAAVVAVAEWFLPAIRVPVGPADRAPWYRRLGIAAIQGAVLSITIGLVNFRVLGDSAVGTLVATDYVQFFLLTGAIGFVIVEAVLDRAMPMPVPGSSVRT
jgi:hypothetical protein